MDDESRVPSKNNSVNTTRQKPVPYFPPRVMLWLTSGPIHPRKQQIIIKNFLANRKQGFSIDNAVESGEAESTSFRRRKSLQSMLKKKIQKKLWCAFQEPSAHR
jgi:hypothetical protein